MIVELHAISRREMKELCLRNLGLKAGSDYSSVAICSVTLRAALWSLSNCGKDSVHTRKLLNTAANLTEPLLDESETESVTDRLKEALAELETIGDVAHTSHGNWVPAPLRYVPLKAVNRWLLVGGCPTHCLPLKLSEALIHEGPARFLPIDPAKIDIELRKQSVSDWAALPNEPVTDLARRVMSETPLAPYYSTEFEFQYYSPSVSGQTLQYYRWVDDAKRLPDGRYLAREMTKWSFRYFIAQVQGGRVVATGPLLYEDVRRLMYGIDAVEKRPTIVGVIQHGDSCQFIVRNELPQAEYRLFTVLGKLYLPPKGYYPRTWEVRRDLAPQVREALQHLGVVVESS